MKKTLKAILFGLAINFMSLDFPTNLNACVNLNKPTYFELTNKDKNKNNNYKNKNMHYCLDTDFSIVANERIMISPRGYIILDNNFKQLGTAVGLYAGTIVPVKKGDNYSLSGYYDIDENPYALARAIENADVNDNGIVERFELDCLVSILVENLAK